MSKRHDDLTDTTVLIAEGRRDRPHDWTAETQRRDQDSNNHHAAKTAADCPFCRGREHQTEHPRLALDQSGAELAPSAGEWATRVVDNKYPVAPRELPSSPAPDPETAPCPPGTRTTANRALHEVVIATPDHRTRLSSLSPRNWRRMFLAWRHRLRRAASLDFAAGSAFVNYGPRAGASLAHLHGQLLATDAVPHRLRQLARGFDRPTDSTATDCPMCARIDHLETHDERVVVDGSDAIAFAPFASRFPFEICVTPRRHRAALRSEKPGTTDSSIPEVASTLTTTLRQLDDALDDPPLNLIVQTAPLRASHARFHWHVSILPALSRGAGFEWGTGWYVNPVAPETAAGRLRATSTGRE